MAKSRITFITLAGAALALTVLGCRNDERSSRPDDANPATEMPQTEELDPERTEGEIGDDAPDEARDQHTWGSAREVPVAEPEKDPVDPDMPEAVDPGADPKQPPPPSHGGTRG